MRTIKVSFTRKSNTNELTVRESQNGNRYVIGTIVEASGFPQAMTDVIVGTDTRLMLTQQDTVLKFGKQTAEAAIQKVAEKHKFIDVTMDVERLIPGSGVDGIGGIVNPVITSIDKGTAYVDEDIEAARFAVAKQGKKIRTLEYFAQKDAAQAAQGDEDVQESIAASLMGAFTKAFRR